MIRQQMFLKSLMFVAVITGAAVRESAATEYVWARSGYGALPIGHNASSFSNGYGGYYVPKNAYGNNHESRRPFTNPNGFIVPATPTNSPATPSHQQSPSNLAGAQPVAVPQQAAAPTAIAQPQMQPIPMKPTFQQKLKRFWSH